MAAEPSIERTRFTVIQVKVKPNARASVLEAQGPGVWAAQLKSPPVEGKANQELIALVAAHFGCRKSAVSIKSGASGRMKLVRIENAEMTGGAVSPSRNNPAMETKWLEDFVSLAETRSFSRSAQLRHVTQPAFSRRIQALEAWAGTDLVDRSSYPTRLTPAGETLYAQSLEMLQALQSTRAMLRGHSAAGQDVIEFAVPHTLAFTFFPAWVSQPAREVRPHQEPADRAERARRGDAAGGGRLRPADRLPPRLAAVPAGCRPLRDGHAGPGDAGAVLPSADAERRAAVPLPGRAGQPLPYLGYAPGAYLGRVADLILKQSGTAIHLDRVYETDMAEGLKVMALEGHGVAFLPHSAVKKELRSRRLVSAAPPEMKGWR